MRRHGVEDWRLPTRRSPGFAERDEHAGPADDGVLRQGHGLPSASAGRCGAWRPAAGRPAPGQVASPGGASLPLVAQQDAAGKARTGGRRPRAIRPPSELCMGVPCASMVGFRLLQTKAPLVWVKPLSRRPASFPAPLAGPADLPRRVREPDPECGPGRCDSHCANTCDTLR